MMDIDPNQMQVDPSFQKLWRLWAEFFDGIPLWDPYGAAFTLFLAGLASGYAFWRMMTEE